MNKTIETQATSNTSNSNFNAEIPQCGEASSSEKEDIGMRKGRRKSNVENTNEEVKGKISEEEEIKIPKCSRKSHVEAVNEKMKGSSSEDEDIGIIKFRRRDRVYIMNKEV